jgi:cytochrome c551/c552
MAGPVFYADMFPKETRLPDYFDKKLFVYDWIRGWVKIVHMNEDGSLNKLEPVWSSIKFHNPIDMEMGPDGKIYVLEYGSGWFSKNPDAGLFRIEYNAGNRAPKVGMLSVDKTSGSLPLKVSLNVEAKDPEKKPLTYKWTLGKEVKETKEPRLEHTFNQAGDYNISVEVLDEEKLSAKSNSVLVYAGNQAPEVNVRILGNQSFYLPGKTVAYEVTVNDKEDGSVLIPSNLFVSADYQEGSDRAATVGHQILSEAMTGKNLMESLDCKSCHKVAEKSIGPSYTDVAKKYAGDDNATDQLINKIIRGGSGVWGEVAMPAHPTLSRSDARMIVTYIRSLSGEQNKAASLPAKGTVPATLNKPAKKDGVLVISATYTDKGGNNIKPQTGFGSVVLGSNVKIFKDPAAITEGSMHVDSIDLTGVSSVMTSIWVDEPLDFGYSCTLYLDSEKGTQLGQFRLPADKSVSKKLITVNAGIQAVTDGKMHNLYLVIKPVDPKESKKIRIVSVEFR